MTTDETYRSDIMPCEHCQTFAARHSEQERDLIGGGWQTFTVCHVCLAETYDTVLFDDLPDGLGYFTDEELAMLADIEADRYEKQLRGE